MSRSLAAILARLERPHVLVIGDLMLDRDITGSADRLAPEAPVPVLAVTQHEESLGGAANLARNLQALGARVSLAGHLGRDAAGERVRALLDQAGLFDPELVTEVPGPTTVKTRYRSGGRLLLRVDEEDVRPGDASQRGDLVRAVAARGAAAIVVSDHAKGVIDVALMKALSAIGTPLFVDPAPGRRLEDYPGATGFAPNLQEARTLLGAGVGPDDPLSCARDIRARSGAAWTLVTCGAKGAVLAQAEGMQTIAPVSAAPGGDPVGAGDSTLAAFVVALASGQDRGDAARLAVVSGALAAEASGAAVVHRAELAARVGRDAPADVRNRVLTAEDARDAVRSAREGGARIVFTNGCFDVLHPGHLALLEEARRHGDLLVVGLNGDASVRRLKGEGRPLLAARDRATLLASLRPVDRVVIFEEATPRRLVGLLEPDVLVKGDDWRGREVVGREVVEARGGRVVFCRRLGSWSTTALVERWQAVGLETAP